MSYLQKTIYDELLENGVSLNNIDSESIIKLKNLNSDKDLSERVHFAGALSDAEFAKAMISCDVVILPYLEVGQSSSGPMSIANEMGCNILTSRNKAFMQYAKYHPNRFKQFEVGNYVQ